MIEGENLTKRFAQHVALDSVSFRVNRGEVVGFLGPNGAGKSTTMRILVTLLAATSGTARVAGLNVAHQPLEARRRLGYMPENNPLPAEMRVGDYLDFRARLKGVANGTRRRRLQAVLNQCDITEAEGRLIGQLSRGFRQRVGLADALFAEPEVIILDEPTAGLDPHQVRGVRELVRNLAGRHTVLISSHILSEVEMTCDRVIILSEGRLVASGSLVSLQEEAVKEPQIVAEINAPRQALGAWLESRDDFSELSLNETGSDFIRCQFRAATGTDPRSAVFEEAKKQGWPLRELRQEIPTLEDIFVHFTRNRKAPKGGME